MSTHSAFRIVLSCSCVQTETSRLLTPNISLGPRLPGRSVLLIVCRSSGVFLMFVRPDFGKLGPCSEGNHGSFLWFFSKLGFYSSKSGTDSTVLCHFLRRIRIWRQNGLESTCRISKNTFSETSGKRFGGPRAVEMKFPGWFPCSGGFENVDFR